MVQSTPSSGVEQPFILRVHWHGGPPAEGPLAVADALTMIEGGSSVWPIAYSPAMRHSRTAIRILVSGVLGWVLEQTPDHTWFVGSDNGSCWAIAGRAVIAVEVFDPVEVLPSAPGPIGFVPPVRVGS